MARFPDKYYRNFPIPRKSGGYRIISAPRTFLKTVQQFIARDILSSYRFGHHITGFVRHKGIVDNGIAHKGAPFLLNVDLSDFFGSVKERHVRQVFERFGFSAEVARLLTGLCTFHDALPQGAPTSPALSNVVFADVDQEILNVCALGGITYSRYADDLTFSSRAPIDQGFLRQMGALVSLHGFRLNARKTRFAKPGQAKYVTGMVVNEKVHPSRDLRRKLRAIFHQAELYPQKFSESASRILGWASFVNSYDQILGAKYLEIARAISR